MMQTFLTRFQKHTEIQLKLKSVENVFRKNIFISKSIHGRLSGKHLKKTQLEIISLFIEYCLNFKTILYAIQMQCNAFQWSILCRQVSCSRYGCFMTLRQFAGASRRFILFFKLLFDRERKTYTFVSSFYKSNGYFGTWFIFYSTRSVCIEAVVERTEGVVQ